MYLNRFLILFSKQLNLTRRSITNKDLHSIVASVIHCVSYLLLLYALLGACVARGSDVTFPAKSRCGRVMRDRLLFQWCRVSSGLLTLRDLFFFCEEGAFVSFRSGI